MLEKLKAKMEEQKVERWKIQHKEEFKYLVNYDLYHKRWRLKILKMLKEELNIAYKSATINQIKEAENAVKDWEKVTKRDEEFHPNGIDLAIFFGYTGNKNNLTKKGNTILKRFNQINK